ncbi:MAG: DUF5615 family PIN-like protein [Chlorobi bacterium]|nr:DUF5615 family PIN-like protein [Chlorobiota bacterium]
MDFIVDSMLPLSLSNFLIQNGHNSIHTSQLPNKNKTKDDDLNEPSITQNKVLITKDSDFENDIRIKNVPCKLLLVKTGNIPNSQLLAIFKNNLPKIVSELNGKQIR